MSAKTKQTKTDVAPKLVIVDEGSAQIKVATITGQPNNDQYDVTPARVVAGHIPDMSTDSYLSDRSYTIAYQQTELSVCWDHEEPRTTQTGREYQLSDDNLVLVHDALRRMGYGGQPVAIYVTLPINLFFAKQPYDKNLVELKKQRLQRTVVNANGLPLADIVSVQVIPEGLPVVYDVLLQDDGIDNPEYEWVERVLVIDIGGTTTDMALISNGTVLKSEGSKSAMFNVRKRVAKLIGKTIAPIIMDKILSTGYYAKADVRQQLDKAAKETADAIVKDVHSFVTDLSSIDLMVLAGGGANVMGQYLAEQFQEVDVVIPDQPDMSIVRGIKKFLAGQNL